jgi:hypothetical protein
MKACVVIQHNDYLHFAMVVYAHNDVGNTKLLSTNFCLYCCVSSSHGGPSIAAFCRFLKMTFLNFRTRSSPFAVAAYSVRWRSVTSPSLSNSRVCHNVRFFTTELTGSRPWESYPNGSGNKYRSYTQVWTAEDIAFTSDR